MKKTLKILMAMLCCLALVLAMGLPALASAAGAEESAPTADSAPTDSAPAPDEETPPAPQPEEPETENSAPGEGPGAETPETEPPETEFSEPSRPYGLALDENSIVVSTYAELKKALGEDNGFTTVYLGADITAEGSPAAIHPGKPFVVVDGSPPSGGRYTFTQYPAANTNGLFVVDSASAQTRQVTLRNMDVVGKNNYGLVWVGAAVSNVVVTLENVNYSGPQALYHRSGTVRVIGGNYTLPSGELAEALHAELGGELVVEGPSANAVLWMVSAGSTLKVLQNANVQISTSNYFVYGTIAGVEMEPGAGLSLVSKRFGFSYAADSVGAFTLAEGAALSINLHTTESYAALRVSKRFEMAPGSSATILRTGTAGIPLRLTAAGAQAVFDQPRRVFFYSGAGVPLRFTGAGSLSITTRALNVWKTASWPLPAGMNALPDHIWNKAGSALLTVTGSYNEAANRGLTSNLSSDDPALSTLNAENFNLEKSQLLAFGDTALEIDAPAASAPALSGSGAAGAGLAAAYTLADGQTGAATGAADPSGRYSLPVSGGPLMAGGAVAVVSKSDSLFMRKTAAVQEAGPQKLAFLAVPEAISFGSPPVPGNPLYVERQQAGFNITVEDTRQNPAPWRIDASLTAPSGADGSLPPASAVVFVTKDGQRLTLNPSPQTVHRQADGAGETIDIQWGPNQGVLLNVVPGEIYSHHNYQATIHWSLVDAP